MPHSFTIFSQCSPIDNPVRGSFTSGETGLKSCNRNCMSTFILSPNEGAVFTFRMAFLKLSENNNGTSELVSTPPAIPHWT